MKTSLTGMPGVHALLIILAVAAVYSNTLESPFALDDRFFILNNPAITDLGYYYDGTRLAGLDPTTLEGPMTMGLLGRRFLSFLTFALSHRIGGFDVMGYHVANIAIHVLNALVVYLLVVLTLRTPRMRGSSIRAVAYPVAFLSAMVFACHPIQTQAVTYISQRFALLGTCFYLLSLAAYVGSRLSGRWLARYMLYALTLVFAMCGMKSKEIVFTLPVAVALYEYMFFESAQAKRMIRLLPIMLTMLVVPLEMVKSGGVDMLMSLSSPWAGYSRGEYLLTQFPVIVTYIRLMFLPVNQNLDHDYPLKSTFMTPEVFVTFMFILCITVFAIWLLVRVRGTGGFSSLVAYGVLWFFITLSVESSVVPTANLIFEHRVYLPMVGASMALSCGAFVLYGALRVRVAKTVFMAMLVCVVVMLSAAAYARNSVWKTDISLWEDVVSKAPGNERGHNNLGNSYAAEGLTDKAIEHYRAALRTRPDFMDAHNNLGNAYYGKGMLEKAELHYRLAVRLSPDYAQAHNNLGNAYISMGLQEKAIKHYRTATSLKPDYAEAHFNLGNAYNSMGRIDRAIGHYRTAIAQNPDMANAHTNLGNSYYRKGLTDRAIVHLKTAVGLMPDSADAHFNLAGAYYKKGLVHKAREELGEALLINPFDGKARQFLEDIDRQEQALQ
jgi:Tfp pilus assembly protein PilF